MKATERDRICRENTDLWGQLHWREALVVRAYYERGCTYPEIAKVLGCSRYRIPQLLSQAAMDISKICGEGVYAEDGRTALPITATWHGEIYGYVVQRCRCDACRLAWADYSARLRKIRSETEFDKIPHGTLNGYENYCCRCSDCREAMNASTRERVERRRNGRSRHTGAPRARA